MKIKAIVSAFIAVLAMTALAQTTPDWENPAVLGINKLPYHATLQLPSKWKECKEIISLDGSGNSIGAAIPRKGLWDLRERTMT